MCKKKQEQAELEAMEKYEQERITLHAGHDKDNPDEGCRECWEAGWIIVDWWH